MAIEFDSAKDARNLAKHGISLARAAELFEQPFREIEDLRADYGERRFIAYGLIEERLFACVYVWRGGRRRIVSLRKANRRETDAYRQTE
ncbi:MAG: BrnT family toxin [Rhodospirillales bacterium]|nr:BrnT family toxin [Rhodospirillales bacterium]